MERFISAASASSAWEMPLDLLNERTVSDRRDGDSLFMRQPHLNECCLKQQCLFAENSTLEVYTNLVALVNKNFRTVAHKE